MSLTITQVLNCDYVTFERASLGFESLKKDVDQYHEDLVDHRKKTEDAWTHGAAREAALKKGQSLQQSAGQASSRLNATALAMGDFAASAKGLVGQLQSLMEELKNTGYQVAEDGEVTFTRQIDPSLASGSEQARKDATGTGSAEYASPASYTQWLKEILDQAQTLDEDTTRKLNDNRAPDAAADSNLGTVPASSIPPKGTDPKKVNEWWIYLTEDQRRYLIKHYPDQVGNLDGIPIVARDEANRITLDSTSSEYETTLAGVKARQQAIIDAQSRGDLKSLYKNTEESGNGTGYSAQDYANMELAKLAQQRKALEGKISGVNAITKRLYEAGSGKQQAYLVGFSAAGDGKAIVSIGNPDTAANVVTYVPGTGTDLSGIGSDLQRVEVMADDARRADPTSETAAVLWLGYDAPDGLTDAADSGYAERSAADLDRFQNGLRATHEGSVASHNTVLGHSYGTTVIGYAAQRSEGINADDLIFVASPGLGVDSASELHGVSPDHMWATTADYDQIHLTNFRLFVGTWSGDPALGTDPTSPWFQLDRRNVFRSDSGDSSWSHIHSSYWEDANMVGRQTMADIITRRHPNG
jgi:hypothetical protein